MNKLQQGLSYVHERTKTRVILHHSNTEQVAGESRVLASCLLNPGKRFTNREEDGDADYRRARKGKRI
jgi:hypothetical protein